MATSIKNYINYLLILCMYLYIYISIGQKTFDIFAQVFDNYSDRWCTNLDLPDSFTTPIFVLVSFLHVHITSRFS